MKYGISAFASILLFSCSWGVTLLERNGPEEISLPASKGGDLVILRSGDPSGEVTRRKIALPEFANYCHVAADSDAFRWIGASNRMFPWVGQSDLTSIFVQKNPVPPTIRLPNKRALLMLFQLKNGKYLTIMPLSGEASVSWLETEANGGLVVDYGTLGTEPVPQTAEVPLLAWAVGDHIYESINQVWQMIAESERYKDTMRLRSRKEYPEPWKYLGWCTWEQYHKNINEDIILGAIRGIENSEIPVRWLLIDDGFQSLKDGRMQSLKPDRMKFPKGWEPIIEAKKEDKIKWMGIWHTLLMYWHNVSPEHEMSELSPYLMPQPVVSEKNPLDNEHLEDADDEVKALIPKDTKDASERFYSLFMQAVKNDGFDFIKTDNVSRSVIEYYGTPNPARAHMHNVLSLEDACNELDLHLMNCSAQNTIGLLNAAHSATMRTSPDYRKNQLASSKSQILQSVFNASWIGQTLWPDHDMFHSSDLEVAETMAITKAMSGGPIYLSDAPADFNKEVISPLCYRDGLLIRPLAPGVPLPESVFSDALYEKEKLYKVIAPLDNRSAAITAYNLAIDNSAELSARITPEDYKYSSVMMQPYEGLWEVPPEGLIVYDWKEQKGSRLGDQGVEVGITGFGHKLLLLCPIEQGWSVVGRTDKFLSPSTVEVVETTQNSIIIKMLEPGPMVIYSELGTPRSDQMSFVVIGDNFYKGGTNDGTSSDSIIRIER